jgi:predicted helicase
MYFFLENFSRNLATIGREIFNQFVNPQKSSEVSEFLNTWDIHGDEVELFADEYAQTVVSSLAVSKIVSPDLKIVKGLKSKHFQKNLFIKTILFRSIFYCEKEQSVFSWINPLVEFLDSSDIYPIKEEFKRAYNKDPILHFFELFLTVYDKKKRKSNGVYFTPASIVTFTVNSINSELKSKFGLPLGLADYTSWEDLSSNDNQNVFSGSDKNGDFIKIIDPSLGTGGFLLKTIDLIFQELKTSWETKGDNKEEIAKKWNKYVPEHLIGRLYGYEIMGASLVISHLLFSLKLLETGYSFYEDSTPNLYMKNSLDLTDKEKNAAIYRFFQISTSEDINKKDKKFTVVMGNPPYSRLSKNKSTALSKLIEPYKFVDKTPLNEKKHWLGDDYIKFMRLGQIFIENSGVGVVGFVTNHGYLDNPTLRGMRNSLFNTFDSISILDLHGNFYRREISLHGTVDENIFGIKQGVSISILTKKEEEKKITYGELWGSINQKNEELTGGSYLSLITKNIRPCFPWYLFTPKDLSKNSEYLNWPGINTIMELNSTGILTARDRFVLDFDDKSVLKRIKIFADKEKTDLQIEQELGLKENYQWKIKKARENLPDPSTWSEKMVDILYRPFDVRRIFYDSSVVWRTRKKVMSNMTSMENIAIITSRMTKGEQFSHIHASDKIVDVISLSPKSSNNAFVFPLYIKSQDDSPVFNISKEFQDSILQLFLNESRENPTKKQLCTGIFNYIFSILHSESYGKRYGEFLSIDFPRIPIPKSVYLFNSLSKLGETLFKCHLLKQDFSDNKNIEILGKSVLKIEKLHFETETIWINKTRSMGIFPVSEKVWNYNIGGYQVLKKWLKQRKSKQKKEIILTPQDIKYFEKMINSIITIIELSEKIDKEIEKYGGWSSFQ